MIVILAENTGLPLGGPLGQIDWWLRGDITRLFLAGKFKGEWHETTLYINQQLSRNKNFLLYGLGDVCMLTGVEIDASLQRLHEIISDMGVKKFIIVPSKVVTGYVDSIKKNLKGLIYEVFE